MSAGEPISAAQWLPFDSLLEELRRRGFPIGADHHLRMNRVLRLLAPECDGPDRLRDVLCPIFATTAEQQEAFHKIFEEWRKQAGIAEARPDPGASPAGTPPPETKGPRWWRAALIAGAALALCVLLGWAAMRAQRRIVLPPPAEPKIVADPPRVSPVTGQVEITLRRIVPAVPEPWWMPLWRENRPGIWAGAAGLLGAWLCFEIWRWRKRRMILQRARQQRKKPPYEILLRTNAKPLLLSGEPDLREARRRFRQREAGAVLRLDVAGTVRATVASGGYPSFRLRPERREPEYLILMDQRGSRDHQLILFEELVKALAGSGVAIHAYTFSGDPRFCRDARARKPIRFSDLKSRFAEARLILLGDGEGLCHPFTGRLVSWADDFAVWEMRAILTPRFDPSDWGYRERELSAKFGL
ncbi:MAG: hypothetical protein EXQ52_05840 [Bryobacterales bacterium]|nr:hypothetical protein [Bryobacterales bacterium]